MTRPILTEPKHYDLAIKNAFILTLDDEWTEFAKGLILVNHGSLEYVGPEKKGPAYSAEKIIDAKGNIVMPSFFNGHTHSAMSLLRGLGSELPLDSWLNEHIWPAEARYLSPHNVYLGSMVSALEMIRCGTGIFVDMYFFQEETVRACEELGIRIVVGEGILDFPTPNKKSPSEGLKYTEYLHKLYSGHPLVEMSVAAHAPYTCSPGVLKEAAELARKLDIPVTIHLAETAAENINIKNMFGKSSTAHLAGLGFFDGRAVAYHCNHLSEDDISILAEHKVGIVTNPRSNMKLGSGLSPLPELMEKGLVIGIGTDGAASNNNQSVLLDMQLAARLYKVKHLDPAIINARQAIRMAVNNNALNYGLEKSMGSLEKGKLADMIIINTDQAHWQPLYDPYPQIVYAMQPGDVITNIINGKIIMENRNILGVDEERFIISFQQGRLPD